MGVEDISKFYHEAVIDRRRRVVSHVRRPATAPERSRGTVLRLGSVSIDRYSGENNFFSRRRSVGNEWPSAAFNVRPLNVRPRKQNEVPGCGVREDSVVEPNDGRNMYPKGDRAEKNIFSSASDRPPANCQRLQRSGSR